MLALKQKYLNLSKMSNLIKVSVLSLLMLSISQIYGQNKSGGEVIYTWVDEAGSNEDTSPHFKLRFNQNESRFFFTNEDEDIPFTLQFVMAKNKNIYTNRKTEKMQETIKGFKKVKMFLVESRLESRDWKITNETKKIGSYTCQKAIVYKDIYEGGRFLFREYAEAWFTKSLPFPFGPEKYGGLPGLILELKIKRLKEEMFKIKDLELLSKVKIIKPTKGEFILFKDYDDIIKRMYDKAESELKKKTKSKEGGNK